MCPLLLALRSWWLQWSCCVSVCTILTLCCTHITRLPWWITLSYFQTRREGENVCVYFWVFVCKTNWGTILVFCHSLSGVLSDPETALHYTDYLLHTSPSHLLSLSLVPTSLSFFQAQYYLHSQRSKVELFSQVSAYTYCTTQDLTCPLLSPVLASLLYSCKKRFWI